MELPRVMAIYKSEGEASTVQYALSSCPAITNRYSEQEYAEHNTAVILASSFPTRTAERLVHFEGVESRFCQVYS